MQGLDYLSYGRWMLWHRNYSKHKLAARACFLFTHATSFVSVRIEPSRHNSSLQQSDPNNYLLLRLERKAFYFTETNYFLYM